MIEESCAVKIAQVQDSDEDESSELTRMEVGRLNATTLPQDIKNKTEG